MKTRNVKRAISAIFLLMIGAVAGYSLSQAMIITKGANKSTSAHNLPTKAEVQAADIRQSEYEFCFNDYLRRTPTGHDGSILVNWVTDSQGNLDLLKLVRTDFNDESFSDCVLNKLRETKFSPTRAGILVSYKFNFRIKGGSIDFTK